MNSTLRDILLILIAIVLLVAVFLPTDRDDQKKPAPTSVGSPGQKTPAAASSTPGSNLENKESTVRLTDVPHPLFPLVVGVEWVYAVDGPEKWVPAEQWTMKVIRAPMGDEPGEISAGYSGNLTGYPVRLEKDGLLFAGLPLMAPPAYLSNPPGELTGTLLPATRYIIPDGVWSFQITRELDYQSMIENRKIVVEKARAIEVDRALVTGLIDVVVPAGIYKAWRVDWISRIEMKAGKGRDVLARLTTEPYRKDAMWFAPGVGLVKRRVSFMESPAEEITFSLVRMNTPTQTGDIP